MSAIEVLSLPDAVRRDIERAVQILTAAGCTGVFLFGSAAKGHFHEGSDLDLAVTGCPKGEFFYLYGRLMLELEYPVDLIDLDAQDPFAEYLQEKGGLHHIG